MLALLIFPGWWGVVVAVLLTLILGLAAKRFQTRKFPGSFTVTHFKDGTTERADNPSRTACDVLTVFLFVLWLGSMWFIFT